MDHPYPWLRYLPADQLDDDTAHFKGMKVESPSGEDLGEVEGFIVDAESGRPYYVVVDSGGWFKSKHFLLPVGDARIDLERKRFAAERLSRERVKHFPGFDLSKFDKMTVEDLKRINEETLQACTVAGVVFTYAENDPLAAAWDRPEFSYPDWWKSEEIEADRSFAPATSTGTLGSASRPAESFDQPTREREAVVAQGDVSPNGRAQPGDVIGLDTDGERTHIGETAEDEDRRREEAQRAAERK